jgi:tungstate transport system substrate-binding protein
LRGYIDVALTYERDQEALAASEGWSRSAGRVMHDHFCIAGPVHDPAGVRGAHSVADALAQIAKAGALFHSRADASATMWKERGLWRDVGLQPWEHLGDASVSAWYKTSVSSPAEALKRADDEGAYLLTVNTLVSRPLEAAGS